MKRILLMGTILYSWIPSAGLTDAAGITQCEHQDNCIQQSVEVAKTITKVEKCAAPYQTFPIVYFGNEIISYHGHNYKVVQGPIWGLQPTMPGQAHLYEDLGICY